MKKELEVVDLSFSYSDKSVLKSISFAVEQGDLFAILGPNAAGKTTLLSILTGHLSAQSGEVKIDGSSINETMQNEIKKQQGFMSDLSGVYLKMTGFEYLSLVAALYEYPPHLITARVNKLARTYNLESEMHRVIKKYSAGTKKKIEFCAAIVHEPKLIFLDEPFESVDPAVSFEIKKNLKDLVQAGTTVVITSHILDTIQNLCNKYMIINHGTVVRQGKIDQKSKVNLEQVFMEVVKDGKTK